jgi:very-short-patch-repair endonuclease
MPPVKRQVSPHAARLRRDATEAELRLWPHLRNRALGGYKFRFQHTIGPFVGDFVCLEKKLIVELDGGQHSEQADAGRTRYLKHRGFRIVRYWNHDVLQNTDGVLQSILLILEQE